MRIFQRNHCNREVGLCLCGESLVVGDDIVEEIVVDYKFVATLLEGDAEDLLALQRFGLVIRVNLDDAIIAVLLGFQDVEGCVGVAGGDDAVGNFALDYQCGALVANVGQRNEIAKRRHPVCATCADVCVGERREGDVQVVRPINLLLNVRQRKSNRSTCGRNVLERRCGGDAGRLFEFAHELPTVESVEEIDVAAPSVENLHGKFALRHIDAGGFLVGVATVFELVFLHFISCFC